MPKADDVRTMFDRISGRYDLMNRVMTMGIDARWRRAAINAAGVDPSTRALDVCCGTGDITFLLAEAGAEQVTGLDFSRGMLDQAELRHAALDDRDVADRIEFIEGDALALPLADHSVDVVTVSFGVRNVESVPGAFAEFARVLRPGGRVVCLEITRPSSRVANAFYDVWFDRVVPLLGGIISRDRSAYTYLPESTRTFPRPPGLRSIMQEAGFTDVTWRRFGGGIVALHRGVVPMPAQGTTSSSATGSDERELASSSAGGDG